MPLAADAHGLRAGGAGGGVSRGQAFTGERVVDDVLVRIDLGARRRAAAQGAGARVRARIGALQRLVEGVAQVAAIVVAGVAAVASIAAASVAGVKLVTIRSGCQDNTCCASAGSASARPSANQARVCSAL